MNHKNAKDLTGPIMTHLRAAGADGVSIRKLCALLSATDKTVNKYLAQLEQDGRAEKVRAGIHVVWFRAGMACSEAQVAQRQREQRMATRVQKKQHDIALHTKLGERAPNISGARLVIEQALKAGTDHTAAELGKLAGIKADQARNIVAKLLHQGLAKHGPRRADKRITYVWHTVCTSKPLRPAGVAQSRTVVNAAMPNGSTAYWQQMISWGR